MKFDGERRSVGPEFLLVIKRLLLQGLGDCADDESLFKTQVKQFVFEELLILDSVHEVVEVVGDRDKWSPRRGTRLLGN